MGPNKVEIVVAVDAATGRATINGVTHDLESISREGQKTNSTLSTMGGLVATVATGFIGLAAVNAAKGFLDTASAFEKLDTRLTTIQGSSAAAEQSLSWIAEFTAKTPYELGQVSDAFVKLNAYGFDAVKWMPMLGDTASSMGKDLMATVEMFADATTGEFERLKEFGVRTKQEGDKVVFSWVENGKQMTASADKTQDGISKALGKVFERFEGGMKDQSAGWEGMTSNMADVWTSFRLDVMDAGVFEELKIGLGEVLETAKRLKDDGTLKEWAGAVNDAIIDVEAEAIRLNMLLDKIGGTMTMIPMGIFAPGAALGNDNSIAQFEKWAQRNIDLEERYKAGDTALQELADRQVAAQNKVSTAVQGTTAAINTQTAATGTATDRTKKQIKEHENYLKNITEKYLPLKAEAAEVEKAHAGLAEQLTNSTITGAEYAVAMDNLYSSTIKVKEGTEQAAEEAKKAATSWKDYKSAMEDLTTGVMSDHQRQVYEIEKRYAALEEKLVDLVAAGRMTYEEADVWQDRLKTRMSQDVLDLADTHKTAADKVDTVWDHTYERMTDLTADWLAGEKVGLDSYGDYFERMVTQMVATWAMGQAKLIFTGGSGSPTFGTNSAPGGSAADVFSFTSTLNGLKGGISTVAGGLNSLQGFTAQGLEALGFGTVGASGSYGVVAPGATGAFGAGTYGSGSIMAGGGSTGAAGAVAEGSSWSAALPYLAAATSAFNAYTAFADGNEIGGTAHTIAAGLALSGNVPAAVVVEVGNWIGEKLGLWGGGGENEFTLSELSGKTDSTWDRNAGFAANAATGSPQGPDNGWYGPIDDAYSSTMNEVQTGFNKLVDGLKSQMSAEAWSAFATALESQTFDDQNGGRWGVSGAQGAITQSVEAYSKTLTTGINTALAAALPVIAAELTGNNSSFAMLTDGMQAAIRTATGASTFGVEQLGQLQTYLAQITQATAPIQEILDTAGLTDYELQIRAINKQFDGYAATLKSAGLDLEKYTALEEARAITLGKVVDPAIQTAIDKEKELAATRAEAVQTAIDKERDLASTRAEAVIAAEEKLKSAYERESSIFKGTIEQFSRLADGLRKFKASLSISDLSRLSPQDKYAEATRQIDVLAARVQLGDSVAMEQWTGAAQSFLQISEEYNASSEAFVTDFNRIMAVTESAAVVADRTASIAQQQLDVLTDQVSSLITINESVLSVREAIARLDIAKSVAAAPASGSAYSAVGAAAATPVTSANNNAGLSIKPTDSAMMAAAKVLYQSATGGVSSSLYNQYVKPLGGSSGVTGWNGDPASLRKIYGFAAGGDHPGGLRLVGESGPELEVTGPARIWNADDTRRMLAGGNDEETKDLLREVRDALRALIVQNGAVGSAQITKFETLISKSDRQTRAIDRRAANDSQ